jgi:hypothetical protein
LTGDNFADFRDAGDCADLAPGDHAMVSVTAAGEHGWTTAGDCGERVEFVVCCFVAGDLAE